LLRPPVRELRVTYRGLTRVVGFVSNMLSNVILDPALVLQTPGAEK
jgi:hypothetical protein